MLLGPPGILASLAIFVFLNIASLGATYTPPVMAGFWQFLNHFWIGAAAVNAERSILYFGGSGVGGDILIVLAWTAAIAALLLLPALAEARTQTRTPGRRRGGGLDKRGPMQLAAIEPEFRTVDGVRIRYADSGGPHERTVLLTSPWPESVYAFAPVWATLAEHARVFAIDLPGFGASERRDDLLSPRAMGGFLARLIAVADLGPLTSSGPMSARLPRCLRRPHIRSGSRACSSVAAEPRFRWISVSR